MIYRDFVRHMHLDDEAHVRVPSILRHLVFQVELLLGWGAEVDVYDRLGYSPYALALKSGSQRCKALLSDLHVLFRYTHLPRYLAHQARQQARHPLLAPAADFFASTS